MTDLSNEAGEGFDRLLYPFAVPGVNATWAVIIDIPHAAINATGRGADADDDVIVGGLIVLAAVMLALFLAVRSLAQRPLHGLVGDVERMTKGDYASDVSNQHREDEIGLVAKALDGFRHKLPRAARWRQRLTPSASQPKANAVATRKSAMPPPPCSSMW